MKNRGEGAALDENRKPQKDGKEKKGGQRTEAYFKMSKSDEN